jgi:hypothetical protein
MFRALAPRLRVRGWRAIIPLVPGEKRPIMRGWERYNETAPSDPLLAAWCAAYPDAGVGLCAGPDKTIAVDLDFLDAPIAKAAWDATQSILGKSPLIRQGRRPKSLHLYQLDDGALVTGRSFGGFELFTCSGQIVLYGVHPDTRRPYEWVGGAEPTDISPLDLPIAAGEKLAQLIAELSRISALDPTRAKSAFRRGTPASGRANTIASTFEASDLTSGWVAAVGPILNAAADPLRESGEIIRHSAPGDRHGTMVGVVKVLAALGYSDAQITGAAADAYIAKFAGAASRAADFRRSLAWARQATGPDAETMRAQPAMASIAGKWKRRRA